MCFSVNVNLVKEELESRYGVSFPDKYRYEPSYYYHAFGLNNLPVICSESPSYFRVSKWGLIPSWVKSKEDADLIRFKTFNARSETIRTKAAFSESFKSKRCIIPVRGFYEWQHVGKKKIPWYIYPVRDDIFTLAGLYSEWNDRLSGEVLETFTVITTEANELMAEIHNSGKRMPVILDKNSEKRWLNTQIQGQEAIDLLKPCPSETLNAHTISPLVNSRTADRNCPEVIAPYTYQSDNLLFNF